MRELAMSGVLRAAPPSEALRPYGPCFAAPPGLWLSPSPCYDAFPMTLFTLLIRAPPPVRLVQHQHRQVLQPHALAVAQVVQQPAGGGHHNLGLGAQGRQAPGQDSEEAQRVARYQCAKPVATYISNRLCQLQLQLLDFAAAPHYTMRSLAGRRHPPPSSSPNSIDAGTASNRFVFLSPMPRCTLPSPPAASSAWPPAPAG